MTSDQSTSELRLSRARSFRDDIFSAPAEGAMKSALRWGLRGQLRDIPPLTLRVPIAKPQMEQLSTCALEDIARLNRLLGAQQCTSIIRCADGCVLPIDSAGTSIYGAVLFSSPIFDSEDCQRASLDVIQANSGCPGSSEPLVRALVESAACAITERWFRLVHRRHWVLAAMRRSAPGTTIVFATDRDQRLVGANRQARQLLESKGQRMGRQFTVSEIFRPNPALLQRRGCGDVSTTLFASGDGAPWIALITPPDPGAMSSSPDARILLHVRPRLDSLAHMSALPLKSQAQRGLSRVALRRIEDHIAAHLDSALDIDDLAAMVRMSSSHFTRSFHKSVGVTPHRYVIQNRVMRARELLATTNLPLTEIALTTGFSDQSHLSRRFQEIVGMPPGVFRGNEGDLTP